MIETRKYKSQFFIISTLLILVLILALYVGISKLIIISNEAYEINLIENIHYQINKLKNISNDFITFVTNNTLYNLSITYNGTCYNVTLISSNEYFTNSCINNPRIFIPINIDCNDIDWYEIFYIKENISYRDYNINKSNDIYICRFALFDKPYIYFKTYGVFNEHSFYNITIISNSNVYNISILNCTIFKGRELVSDMCCQRDFVEIAIKDLNITEVEILSESDFCRLK